MGELEIAISLPARDQVRSNPAKREEATGCRSGAKASARALMEAMIRG
jgi:hypothetical protein